MDMVRPDVHHSSGMFAYPLSMPKFSLLRNSTATGFGQTDISKIG
jgi:hypothetical protein